MIRMIGYTPRQETFSGKSDLVAALSTIQTETSTIRMIFLSQMLHVWNIYLHLPQKSPSYVGKYTIHRASGSAK